MVIPITGQNNILANIKKSFVSGTRSFNFFNKKKVINRRDRFVDSAAPKVLKRGINIILPIIFMSKPKKMYFAEIKTWPSPCNIPEEIRIKLLKKMAIDNTERTVDPSLVANNIVFVGFIMLIKPIVAPRPMTVVIFNAESDFSCIDFLSSLFQATEIIGTRANANEEAATVPSCKRGCPRSKMPFISLAC